MAIPWMAVAVREARAFAMQHKAELGINEIDKIVDIDRY
jgi:hypothetical protein